VVEVVLVPVEEPVEEEEELPDLGHLETLPKTNPEHDPLRGPLLVASTQRLVEPHQPQKGSRTQLEHDVKVGQSRARQFLKNHWVQLAATPPGPTRLPGWQVVVVSHQPQPFKVRHESQCFLTEQSVWA
jgi:hypothetical protein